MDIKIYKKMMSVEFISVNGVEFRLNELMSVLDMLDYEDIPVKNSDIPYLNVIGKLEDMGIVEKYIGSRMSVCYRITGKDKFDAFMDAIVKLSDSSDIAVVKEV